MQDDTSTSVDMIRGHSSGTPSAALGSSTRVSLEFPVECGAAQPDLTGRLGGRYSFALAESVAQGALRPLHDADEWDE